MFRYLLVACVIGLVACTASYPEIDSLDDVTAYEDCMWDERNQHCSGNCNIPGEEGRCMQ
ncbi:hypothetical protein KIPB_012270, partial [Kipferlia bialata]|eukprot:g12270.t1